MPTLTINGVSFAYPSTGSSNWGTAATNWASAVTSGMLQKAGGNFTLTADVNFGATYGLLSQYFTSRTTSPASAGVLRLANADFIKWRNSVNGADVALGPGSSDTVLSYAGIDLANISGAQVLTNKSIDGNTNTITNVASATVATTAVTTNASYFPLFVSSASNGNQAANLTATGFTFNPSTKALTASTFIGALTGTASGNLTATPSNHGVLVSGAANAVTVIAPDASTTKAFISGGASADPGWGTLAIGGGGTGQTTKAAAFDALQPMTTLGDIIYGGASGTGTRLAGNTATSTTLLSSVGSGGVATAPAWLTAATAATASTVALRDANGNLQGNAFTRNYATTATSATTTTLTVSSARIQFFTGATTQNCVLPAANTLSQVGDQFEVHNNSSGIVTVKDNGGNVILAQPGLSTTIYTVTNIGSANGAWDASAGSASPLTTKGDIYTYSSTGVRHAVPGDYGRLVPDSTTSDGWRTATYMQAQRSPLEKNYVQFTDFENNSLLGWNWCNTGTLTTGIPTGTPDFTSVRTNALYAFTISTSTTCAVGDTYTNNGQTFTIVTALSAVTGTVFFATGTGDPLASGTLTRATGAGTASITFSAFTKETMSVVSSGQLSGTYSMSLATSGATTAGLGYCSDAIAIDKSDQAKVLSFKFSYSAIANPTNANWSGTSSNSFGVAVYDVTNSTWLGTAGQFNFIQSSGVGVCQGTFQTGATTASIRLVVYNVSATTGAVTLYFDDFYVGPQALAFGAAMTDWQAYTPSTTSITLGNGTVATNWRRVGQNIQIQGHIIVGSTTSFTGTIELSPPSGVTLDTTFNSGQDAAGTAYYYRSSGVQFTGTVYGFSSNRFLIVGPTAGYWNATVPIATAAADQITFIAEFPVVGWSSQTTLSNDSDTRVAAFLASSPTATVTGSASDVSWTSIKDTHGNFDGTKNYTVPISGYYYVDAWLRVDATYAAGNDSDIYILVDGSVVQQGLDRASGAQTSMQPKVSAIRYLNAGQVIRVQVASAGTSPTVTAGTAFAAFSIFRLSGPAVVAASESVNARYYGATATLTGSFSDVTWSTKDYDSHNAMSGTTYTVPVTGTYDFQGQLCFSAATIAAGNIVNIELLKNGTLGNMPQVQWIYDSTQLANRTVPFLFSGIHCVAGDTIKIDAASSATTPTIPAVNNFNWITIKRVGN